LQTEDVWVRADRARIEQVLANLLENAGKFSTRGSPIDLVVRKDGENAVMEVTDEGVGIAPDQLEQVFGLFVQAESAGARVRGGMGVGLALVKRLVELHGGSVKASSAGLGHGATFSVRLPLAPEPQVKTSDDSHPVAVSAPRALRILVTEDNDDAREMMRIMLTMDGHEVTVASNGAETLAAVVQAPPDVILMDIGLPDMQGYDVARRIGESDARLQVKLVALTGFGQAEDERRAYDAGFDVHLTKPVSPKVLREVLAALTRGTAA
jgi:CheY-like chemotaxis protein